MIAVGVASPKAHGHAITRTDTRIFIATPKDSPAISQMTAEMMAIAATTGTNMPLILSASLAMGALLP